MAAWTVKFKEEFLIQSDSAFGLGVQFHHPTANTLGIELLVPRSIQRVGEINALAITAHFYHLRSTIQWSLRGTRMCRAPDDAAQVYGTRKFRMKRIEHIILLKFSRAPTRDVQKAVVQRKIDVRDQRRHGFEPFKQRREFLRVGRLRWNFDHLLDCPFIFFAMPQPDRSRKIFERNTYAYESVGLGGIVRGSQFQYHLLLGAKIER